MDLKQFIELFFCVLFDRPKWGGKQVVMSRCFCWHLMLGSDSSEEEMRVGELHTFLAVILSYCYVLQNTGQFHVIVSGFLNVMVFILEFL